MWRCRVRSITTQDVRLLIAELRATGLSGATACKVVALLGSIMQIALEEGDVARNPVAVLKRGERKAEPVRKRRALTDAELALLVEHAGSAQTKRLISFLAGSGLRLHECLGLHPCEVEHGLVTVSEQLERGGERRAKLKTAASERIVALLPDAFAAATAQKAWRLSLGVSASPWLWTTPGGRPLDGTCKRRSGLRR